MIIVDYRQDNSNFARLVNGVWLLNSLLTRKRELWPLHHYKCSFHLLNKQKYTCTRNTFNVRTDCSIQINVTSYNMNRADYHQCGNGGLAPQASHRKAQMLPVIHSFQRWGVVFKCGLMFTFQMCFTRLQVQQIICEWAADMSSPVTLASSAEQAICWGRTEEFTLIDGCKMWWQNDLIKVNTKPVYM